MQKKYVVKIGKNVIHPNPHGMGKVLLKHQRDALAREYHNDSPYDRLQENPTDPDIHREIAHLVRVGKLPYISEAP